MALSDIQVFDQFYLPAIHESLSQMVDGFNAASNGAIVLANAGNVGDYILNSFYDSLVASQRRVDRYGSNTTVSPTDMSATKLVAVKVAGGFGPIRYEPSQMTWLRKPTAEAVEMISRQFAEAVMQDQLNTAIRCLVAAIENQSSAKVDKTGVSKITQTVLNQSHAKFGDMSQSLVAQIMCGAQYHNLIGDNLANTPTLFTAGNVTVVEILGKRVVVTDSPSLTVNDLGSPAGPDIYKVLSLVPNACIIRDPADPIVNIETSNGNQRIETTLQADYDFTVELKGYSWDTANGGKSPSDAELELGSNWDLVVSNIKHSSGVIAIGNQA